MYFFILWKEKLMEYKKFDFKGIKRIEIPRTDDDFTARNNFGIEIIKRYLPSILSTHSENADKIDYFYKYYLGEQDILKKERLHEKDKDNNHIVVENHAKRQVDFSTGFITSEKREYTHKIDSSNDDLIYLDRYFTDCRFFDKDKELKNWVFISGLGIVYAAPRTDFIETYGTDPITNAPLTRYNLHGDLFDIDYNAPFVLDTIDPRYNFVVYSSRFDKTPLLCVSIVDVDVTGENDKMPIIHKEIHIETRYAHFNIESDGKYTTFYPNGINDLMFKGAKALRYLPMLECSINPSRQGIIETNRDLFNQINYFKSDVADMITDNANPLFVFINADVDADDIKNIRTAGGLVLNDLNNGGNGGKADFKVVASEIQFDGLNQHYEELIIPAYDIAGVPLASGQISSGGSNNQAVVVGSGLSNSYIVAKNNITSFMSFDYELLRLILYFCKQIPNCPVNELNANQVDIKYNIDMSDNFLTKAQGMYNLYNMNMPKKAILKASGMFNDITTLTAEWKKEDEQEKSRAEKIDVVQTTDKNDNNSQE